MIGAGPSCYHILLLLFSSRRKRCCHLCSVL